jgi:hypothetical protein
MPTLSDSTNAESETETANVIADDLFEQVIRHSWDLEALVLFGSCKLPLLECINRVIGRYLLLAGRSEPLVDAVIRSRQIPEPQILRILGKMHEPALPDGDDELPPYIFVTIDRRNGAQARPSQHETSPGASAPDDATLLRALDGGDVLPLARMFKSGHHPGWDVVIYYAPMHCGNGNTPFTFQIKRRDGRQGRRIDPEIRLRQFLAAGTTEWGKRFNHCTHENACVESGVLKSDGDHEQWSRKASKVFGKYFRRHLPPKDAN